MKKRVVVGLSGGVDSSVAAYLLKKQGYDVIGLFMINWHDTTGTLEGDCPWHDELIFAELVAKKLDIPIHTVDFSEQYKKRIVDYMFKEYQQGRTPNPDVLCNREVKFDLFIDESLKYNADCIATGHYCRKEIIEKDGKSINRLLSGLDPNKDQSYFLCQLSQKQLDLALFPIGNLLKSDVRKIATDQGLVTASKKDSQGLCFIGKVDLPTFLQQQLKAKKGITVEIPEILSKYIDYQSVNFKAGVSEKKLRDLALPFSYKIEEGTKVGEHNGAHFFTIGQNKGLNIGGRPKQSFVIEIDTIDNILYTGLGQSHPGLYRQALFIPTADIHWIREDLKLQAGESVELQVRIRYRQTLQNATLYCFEAGLYILFNKKQRGITPGQFAAWYKDDELMGSGSIQ